LTGIRVCWGRESVRAPGERGWTVVKICRRQLGPSVAGDASCFRIAGRPKFLFLRWQVVMERDCQKEPPRSLRCLCETAARADASDCPELELALGGEIDRGGAVVFGRDNPAIEQVVAPVLAKLLRKEILNRLARFESDEMVRRYAFVAGFHAALNLRKRLSAGRSLEGLDEASLAKLVDAMPPGPLRIHRENIRRLLKLEIAG
jgi:hypothetical protein